MLAGAFLTSLDNLEPIHTRHQLILLTAPPQASRCAMFAVLLGTTWEEPSMEEITTIGPDIDKSVFQVRAISATGTDLVRRQLKPRFVVQLSRTSALSCWHRSLHNRASLGS